MVAAISRDALVAQCECQIMSQVWEAVWGGGARVSWADVCRERAARASDAAAAAVRLAAAADGANVHGSEIYSNIPVTVTDIHHRSRLVDARYPRYNETSFDEPLPPMHPPYAVPPHLMYPLPHDIPVTVTSQLVMTPYGVPYYYPVQAPYMIPTPVYAPIKQATNVPINGYPPTTQYNRYPSVPTAQLIELDSPSVYENGRFDKHRDDDRSHRRSRQPESSRRNSTSKSGFSDVSLPSLPRSDTQPALSKAREDGMGTYESWDYVFRNLSSKEQDGETRSRYSPSLDRDSRTLDRLDREERRAKYQPTTLDLEDGLQALNIDRSYDEDAYRTAKVNENLMRLKQEQELKRAKQLARKQMDERKPKKLEPIKSDALISTKVAPDKVKLLSKKDVKDRKEVIKQQSSMNGSVASVEAKKVRKPAKLVAAEAERPARPAKPLENGHSSGHSSKTTPAAPPQANYDLKAQLIVSLDEPDARRSPPRPVANGDPPRPASAAKRDRWECSTCTYLNKDTVAACEMCGKSKRGPEIQPLTSGGRECPACTLVNRRDARVCDACGTSLDHCPTYI
ncbi:uncharacterized protein LOC114365237 isoform X3 [Ostrinia furnacalis]|nr:uncharacterized protein LOC114365237 isoform X2 [Ostrinia furnacalis]XP_028177576.1 uncharacterized protein LOC114365237 isoform X3 [Ostrinia furnacalis]